MQPYLLTTAARDDLLNIGRFTAKKWGKQQRNKYLKQLDDAFTLLSRQPEAGRSADDIKRGYRKFRQGSHLIFYRVGDESHIVIIRVLHKSIDVERHF